MEPFPNFAPRLHAQTWSDRDQGMTAPSIFNSKLARFVT
jgi:hypothetical protein